MSAELAGPPRRAGRLAWPALLAFAVAASVAMGFSFNIMPLGASLDSAYMYAHNFAAVHPEKWAGGFASTYGPYGYLIGAMDLGRLIYLDLAFGVLLAAGFGVAAAVYARSAPDQGLASRFAVTAGLVYGFAIQGREYKCLSLFLVVLLAGLLSRSRRSLAAYAVAGLLSGFFLLIKFSLGVAAIATLAAGCLLRRRPREIALHLVAAAPAVAAGFLVGWLAAGIPLGGIPGYLSAGWEMSRGYSSAMGQRVDVWSDVACFLVWFGLLGLWVWRQPGPGSRLVLAGLALPLFVAWKHSIVRPDHEHIGILVKFGVFVLAVLLARAVSAWPWRDVLPAVAVLLVPLVPTWATRVERPYSVTLGPAVLAPLRLGGIRDLLQVLHLGQYRDRVARHSFRGMDGAVLSDPMRQAIGRAPVDVYPWVVTYAPANRLNWVGRPIPASFNAFTPALDDKNAAFLRSAARPAYLLWHARRDHSLRSIDERYQFWDEPRTLRAIADSYDVAAADGEAVLLRAREGHRFAEPEPLGTSTIPWDAWLDVPRGPGVLLASLSVRSSPLRPLVRALFREEPLYLRLRFASDSERVQRFRLVLDNMGSGIWLSPLALAFDELPRLIARGEGREVVAISVESTDAGRWLIGPVSVKWSRMLPLAAPKADGRDTRRTRASGRTRGAARRRPASD